MITLLQWLIVGVLVTVSAVYALWSLASLRLRLRLLGTVDAIVGSTRVTSALRLRVQASLAGGCGSCKANVTEAQSAKSAGRREAAPPRPPQSLP